MEIPPEIRDKVDQLGPYLGNLVGNDLAVRRLLQQIHDEGYHTLIDINLGIVACGSGPVHNHEHKDAEFLRALKIDPTR